AGRVPEARAAVVIPTVLVLTAAGQLLDAPVPQVGDVDVAIGVGGDVGGGGELARAAALRAEASDRLAIGREDLHAVVAMVEDVKRAVLIDRHPAGNIELDLARALGAPLHAVLAGRVEHLDAVGAAIGDEDVALLVDRDAARQHELTVAGPILAPTAHIVTVGVEDLNARIAGVGDVEVAVRADREGLGAVELPVAAAKPADLAALVAGLIEADDPVVLRVENPDIAVLVDLGVLVVEGTVAAIAAKRADPAAVRPVNLDAVFLIVDHDDIALWGDSHAVGRLELVQWVDALAQVLPVGVVVVIGRIGIRVRRRVRIWRRRRIGVRGGIRVGGRDVVAAVAPGVIVQADVARLDLPAFGVVGGIDQAAPLEALQQHVLVLPTDLDLGPVGFGDRQAGGVIGRREERVGDVPPVAVDSAGA